MWSCLLHAVAMSATVQITFDSDTEALELGFPKGLSVEASPLVIGQSSYQCDFGPQGELSCAWLLRTPPPTPSPTPTRVTVKVLWE